MSTEIAVREVETVVASKAMDILQIIANAAADPNVNVEKWEALLRMRKEIMDEQHEQAFNQAMASLQTKLPRITKTGRILTSSGAVRSTYAPIEDIDVVVRPLLAEHGMSTSYDTDWKDGMLTVFCTVKHVLGHKERSKFTVPMDKNASRSGAQDMGASGSFAKRYALCNALNIITVNEDTDGVEGDNSKIEGHKLSEIRKLLADTNANVGKFCELMKVKAVEDITNDQYQIALDWLNRKAKKS